MSSSRGLARDAAAVLGVLLLVGIVCGVVWSRVVTPAVFTRAARGGSMDEAQLALQFGADAWFAVIGLVAGGLAGLGLAWWCSRDPLVTGLLLLAGSVLAAVAMALVGHWLGPGDPRAALRSAPVGAIVPDRLDVGSTPLWPLGPYLRDTAAVYLVWPVAVLLGALFELVGRRGDAPDDARSADPDISTSQGSSSG